MSLEWFASATVAVTGSTLFGPFEERTPKARRLLRWAAYLGVMATPAFRRFSRRRRFTKLGRPTGPYLSPDTPPHRVAGAPGRRGAHGV